MFDQLDHVASGLVIADEMTNANVLIMDVFTALFRVDTNVELLLTHFKHRTFNSFLFILFIINPLGELMDFNNDSLGNFN